MQPITYKWDERIKYCTGEDITPSQVLAATPDGTHKKDSLEIGFSAQDVLAIEQANGYGSNNDTSLLVDLSSDETSYGLKYERLVPILVSALKEADAKIEALTTRIEELEK